MDEDKAWLNVRMRFDVVNKIVKSFINVINGYVPDLADINFYEIANNTINELKEIAVFNKVKIFNKLKLSNKTYYTDENAIKAFLIILISNAIDEATKTESNRMVIIEADEFSEFIFIKITDNGPSICKELMEKLFEIKDSENARIGLVTVAMLVKALNGRVEVSSSNDGDSFMVFLPI